MAELSYYDENQEKWIRLHDKDHPIESGDLSQSLQDSISRNNALITNLLQVDLNNPDASINAPKKIISSQASTELINAPSLWSTYNTVIAHREVFCIGTHRIVLIFEGYPKQRVWINYYNAGIAKWSGWFCLDPMAITPGNVPSDRKINYLWLATDKKGIVAQTEDGKMYRSTCELVG